MTLSLPSKVDDSFGNVSELFLNQTVTVTCSTSKVHPSPLLTASIVDSSNKTIRELNRTSEGVSSQDEDQTYSLEERFVLTMTENDAGNYVQCTSQQGSIAGTFDSTVSQKLAVRCGCSEVGSRNLTYCHPKTGQCECYQNFAGLNCDSCAENYLSYPSCNGLNSKRLSIQYTRLFSRNILYFQKVMVVLVDVVQE